ncbi:hypothetical protein MUY27_03315 [Mucilaginibacter sp. RS28]|uniref:Uncharacterized protein n=1 Tax=Mucilaginibacter straminoryzae TaxID=2932774 RepID=A0A9X1X0V5_9SPHI|nr:hypothetical protein [Mucilaginibacter straminoryzae]MCJ8208721.1 hypothetical protein [Mucilaginibacter straminoryzae]
MTIKKQSARVLAAFLLLMTFVTGQLIVIAHKHEKVAYNNHQGKKSNDEVCKICAQNSHLQLFNQQQQDLFTLTLTAVNTYREYIPAHYSAATFYAADRGPPVC